MNINRKWVGLAGVAALALSASAAMAQDAAPAKGAPPDQDVFYFNAPVPGPMMPPDGIGVIEFEGTIEGKTVTGAPFTATFSTQRTQTLADGNHIENNTTGTIARDSQGRTRRDMTLNGIGPWSSEDRPGRQVSAINDPVAGTHFVLIPERKVARQMPGFGHKANWTGERGERGAKADRSDNANVITASLGTQTINGVSAEGTRTTRTIPAGAIGNEKPIVITVERWYSPELQTMVVTKRSDPRVGDSVTQLTKIQRQEPAASLFQIPADYKIQNGHEGGGHHGRHQTEPPPPPAQ
jgi:hypothetical protein